MGAITPFRDEKLLIPILVSRSESIEPVLERLISEYGEIDHRSQPIDFVFTDYYSNEMGVEIDRYLISFAALVNPSKLAEIKIFTNRVEEEMSVGTHRRVNLDPGLLSLDRLVLASTKDNGRRIPLKSGIYAEITLIYHHGRFHSIEWTYPDYQSEIYHRELSRIRSIYKAQIGGQESRP